MVAMAIEFRVQVCMLFTLSHEFLKGGRGGRKRREEEEGRREQGQECNLGESIKTRLQFWERGYHVHTLHLFQVH